MMDKVSDENCPGEDNRTAGRVIADAWFDRTMEHAPLHHSRAELGALIDDALRTAEKEAYDRVAGLHDLLACESRIVARRYREFGPLKAAADAELSAHKHEQYAETIRGLFSHDTPEGVRLGWVATTPPARNQQPR